MAVVIKLVPTGGGAAEAISNDNFFAALKNADPVNDRIFIDKKQYALSTLTFDSGDSFDAKDNIDCAAGPDYPAASKGDIYRVSVAGKIGGGAGPDVLADDLLICWADNAGGTHHAVGTSWIIQKKLSKGAALTAADNTAIDAVFDATEEAVLNNVRTRLNELVARLQANGLLS